MNRSLARHVGVRDSWGRAVAMPAALAATLALTVASWILAVRQMRGMQMDGMGMGTATRVGSFGFFLMLWVTMMAAMMLPGAVPAMVRRAHVRGQARAAPAFLGAYLGVWTLVGLGVYALYRPHGQGVAAAVVISAGLYELTPLKLRCRQWCRVRAGSGLEFGLCCVGSSLGLMLILVAVNAMSITWMVVITVLVIAQKLSPARTAIDVSLAIAIIALGVLIAVAPSSVPGLI